MSIMIKTEELELRHGSKRAVMEANVAIPAGSVTALLGRNGAGKSTFLDAVVGLLPPSSGIIRVLGEDPWRDGSRLRREIGYVEADPFFEPGDRLRSILKLWRVLHPGWSEDEAQRLMKSFELDEGMKVRTLSRGMRTKFALLLALAQQPRLLVLDEPFDGLDCAIRDEILAEVVRHVGAERAIVIASHDLDEVERVADRAIVIHEGRIRFDDQIRELRARARRFVGRASDDLEAGRLHGLASLRRFGGEVELTFFEHVEPEELANIGLEDIREMPLADLKDAFLAATGDVKETVQ